MIEVFVIGYIEDVVYLLVEVLSCLSYQLCCLFISGGLVLSQLLVVLFIYQWRSCLSYQLCSLLVEVLFQLLVMLFISGGLVFVISYVVYLLVEVLSQLLVMLFIYQWRSCLSYQLCCSIRIDKLCVCLCQQLVVILIKEFFFCLKPYENAQKYPLLLI